MHKCKLKCQVFNNPCPCDYDKMIEQHKGVITLERILKK